MKYDIPAMVVYNYPNAPAQSFGYLEPIPRCGEKIISDGIPYIVSQIVHNYDDDYLEIILTDL